MNEKNALDFDQTIIQGSTYSRNFRLEIEDNGPINLTGFGLRGQIRPTATSDNATDFDINILDAVQGQINIFLSPADTAELTPGINVYDIELYNLTDATDVKKIMKGRMRVRAEVTR